LAQIMACIIAAVDKYGDLMRMAIATPGNDFRLGGMEAPPAVMSTYLGEDLTNYLKAFVENPEVGEYKAGVSLINLGIPYLPEVFVRAPSHSPSPSRSNRYSALFSRFRWDGTGQRCGANLGGSAILSHCADGTLGWSDAASHGGVLRCCVLFSLS